MQSGHCHEKRDDNLDPNVVIVGNTEVFRTESARGDRRKGVVHRIEPIHAGNAQQHGLYERQSDIHDQQDMQNLLGLIAVIILGHR